MPRFVLPFLAAALVACGSGPATVAAFTSRDSAGIRIAENDPAQLAARCAVDSAPLVAIGGAEDRADLYLHRVFGATRLTDGRIALVNQGSSEVRWYDSTGALVGRAGRSGSGPGEFKEAFLLYRSAGDSLFVGDYRPWQWHVFGPEMTFVRTARTTPTETNSPRIAAVLDNGQQLFGRSEIGRRTSWAMDSIRVFRYDPEGALLDTVVTMAAGRYGQTVHDPGAIWMQPWFEASPQAEAVGNRFVVASWNAPELTVYEVGEQVVPTGIVRWRTGDRAIPASAVEAARDKLAHQYPDLSADLKARMIDPMIDPARPVADEYPAVRGLVVGRDGRTWVHLYEPGDPDPGHWLAFSAEGRAVCHATLPPISVYEIGRDYLVGHATDSLGRESVVEYQLHPPEGS